MLENIKNELLSGKFGLATENENLKYYTTFKIGGPADILIKPDSESQLSEVVKFCKKNSIPLTVIGKGSNLLVRDKGVRGVVIALKDNFSKIEVNGLEVTAQSGALLRDVAIASFSQNLTGMESVSGIPGSVGGAIVMNAGAYGTEMIDIVKSVRCMDDEGNIKEYTNQEMDFSYRHSLASKKGLLVLSATFLLQKGENQDIQDKFNEYDYKRSSKQPLEKNSAGSTFKRPEGHFASKLIDDTGLRGFTVGDAQVSEKHCGFLINIENSTCENMLELIRQVQEKVYEKYNVKLEREVKLIGEE
ncbi:UDP-N-acetylmuramate dehydrogenase [Helcococcus bovis]|uniref:UDP-N-acetylmuramate dehydrogenase n=1 Tax=Helcococcus bovis TaxID=3153252 RepID=UPI0038B8C0ED